MSFGGGGGGSSQYADYLPENPKMTQLEDGLYDVALKGLNMYNSPITQTGPSSPALGTNSSWGFGNQTYSGSGNNPANSAGGQSGYAGDTTNNNAGYVNTSGNNGYSIAGNPVARSAFTLNSGDYQKSVENSQKMSSTYDDMINATDAATKQRNFALLNGQAPTGSKVETVIGNNGQPMQTITLADGTRYMQVNHNEGSGSDGQYTSWEKIASGPAQQQQQQQQPTSNGQPTLQDILFQDALNKQLAGSERYDVLTGQAGDLSNGAINALNQSETAGDWYFGEGQDSFMQAKDMFNQAKTAGDPWYNKGWDSYDKSNGLIDQQVDQLNYSREGNQWYDNYVRDQLGQSAAMTSSGEIPQAFKDAILGNMNRALESSMGSLLNDYGSRGVMSSSQANSGIANLGQQAANAYQDNYLQNFDTLLKGIQGNAAQGISGGDTFGRINLDIANGYGDAAGNSRLLGDSYVNAGTTKVHDLLDIGNSYNNNANSLMDAGSQRIQDWLNINQGYNDTLNQNLLERQYLNNAVPQYWQNALGPFSIVPDLLGQQQQDRANTDRMTTVVR